MSISAHQNNQTICINCFKSLSVPACMKMYQYLREHGASTVKTLTEMVKLTQPTVSYHLKEMKAHGLLTSKKVGKEVFYDINQICTVYHDACVVSSIKFPEIKANA